MRDCAWCGIWIASRVHRQKLEIAISRFRVHDSCSYLPIGVSLLRHPGTFRGISHRYDKLHLSFSRPFMRYTCIGLWSYAHATLSTTKRRTLLLAVALSQIQGKDTSATFSKVSLIEFTASRHRFIRRGIFVISAKTQSLNKSPIYSYSLLSAVSSHKVCV